MEWNGHTTPIFLSRQAYDASFAVQSNKLVRLSENFLSQQTLMWFVLDVVYDLYPGSHYFHTISCPLSHDPGAG